MPSPTTIDIEALLRPIPGENPAGESVRYTGAYDAIQEARRSDDDLPMGEWQREAKKADWPAVIRLCTETLTGKSKDIQVAVWLLEALVKRQGFAGLRDGMCQLRELLTIYWDRLYPEAEDGDLEFRAGPLEWMNLKLPLCIQQLALTADDPPFSFVTWQEALRLDNLARQDPSAKQKAISEGKIDREKFEAAIEATPRAFYEDLFDDVRRSKEELAKLEGVIDAHFGQNALSLIGMRNSIDECFTLIDSFVKKKRERDPSYKPEASIQSDGELARKASQVITPTESRAMATTQDFAWSAEPTSREEAFQRLAVIASYLKRAEPQHPVSYLLERAVNWTKMPLETWLGEVVQNEDVLNRLWDTLGIKR